MAVLLGLSCVEDLTDPATGEIGKLGLVTDNRLCFKSRDFAAWVACKRHIIHFRTRKKSPWPNCVNERFFEALKCSRNGGSRLTARQAEHVPQAEPRHASLGRARSPRRHAPVGSSLRFPARSCQP